MKSIDQYLLILLERYLETMEIHEKINKTLIQSKEKSNKKIRLSFLVELKKKY